MTLIGIEAMRKILKDAPLFKLMELTRWTSTGWRISIPLPWYKQIIFNLRVYWFVNYRTFFTRLKFYIRDLKYMCVNPRGRKEIIKEMKNFIFGGTKKW